MSKLDELLPLFDENDTLYLVDYDTDVVIDIYDGKQALDGRYNACEVMKIKSVREKSLYLFIRVE